MRRLLFALASIALLGCGSDSSTGPAASAEGTWNLQTVSGSPLPYTLQSTSTFREEIVSDQYVLTGDGLYTENFAIRDTQGTQVTENNGSDSGTWTQNGNQVNITSADATTGTVTGTINGTGDKFTINVQGVQNFVLVYAKQ